jgi:aspartate-semialdehyde dehydrogenase
MIDETRKIFHAPGLAISATCVRVPVAVGHSEAIHIELQRPMEADEAREILRAAPGTVVLDEPRGSEYPMPLQTAGQDPVYVGRIRKDPSHARGLALWVVGDNLRKGAALNAIQVFELVARNGWQTPALRQEVHA